jgi:hypothetical protein
MLSDRSKPPRGGWGAIRARCQEGAVCLLPCWCRADPGPQHERKLVLRNTSLGRSRQGLAKVAGFGGGKEQREAGPVALSDARYQPRTRPAVREQHTYGHLVETRV